MRPRRDGAVTGNKKARIGAVGRVRGAPRAVPSERVNAARAIGMRRNQSSGDLKAMELGSWGDYISNVER